MSLSEPLSRRAVIFSGKRLKSQERGRILPTRVPRLRYVKYLRERRNGHDPVFDLHCWANSGTFGVSSKGSDMRAASRVGPTSADSSSRRFHATPYFLVLPFLRKHIRDRVKRIPASETFFSLLSVTSRYRNQRSPNYARRTRSLKLSPPGENIT